MASVCYAESHTLCENIKDCSFYKCVEQKLDSLCSVWENPIMQAQYLCEKMAKSNFSKEVYIFN